MEQKIKTVEEVLHDQNTFNTVRGFITWVNDFLFEKANRDNAEATLVQLASELLPVMGYERLNRLLNYSVVADELDCATVLRYAYMINDGNHAPYEYAPKPLAKYEARVKDILKGLTQTIEDSNIIRICSNCSRMMLAGYVFDEGQDYYCCEACLNTQDDKWIKESQAGESLYYTEWF